MRSSMLSLFSAALLVSFTASAQEVKKGSTAKVGGWEWVNVVGPTVPSGNSSFGYGDSCGIQRGGVVTVVGIDGNRLLVRYSITGTMYGTPCPTGVVFFLMKERFSKMTGEYDRALQLEQAEKDLVRRLLK